MLSAFNFKLSLIASAIAMLGIHPSSAEASPLGLDLASSIYDDSALQSAVSALPTAEGEKPNAALAPVPSLSEARTQGRLKSLYLKSTSTTKAPATDVAPIANLADFKAHIAPSIKNSCITCHGPDKQKGHFRIDTLNPDLVKGSDMSKWQKVFDAISSEDMPPDNDKNIHLDEQERSRMTKWLEAELTKASRAQNNLGASSSFRRMTRYEYNYALQDITGLPYEFSDLLPPESDAKDGFLNSASLLQMSGMQLERYRDIGLAALQKATVKGDPPPIVSYSISMENLMSKVKEKSDDKKYTNKNHVHFKDLSTGKLLRFDQGSKPKRNNITNLIPQKMPAVSPAVLVIGPNQSVKLNLGSNLPDTGIMRVRIRLGRTSLDVHEYASVRLFFSVQTSNNANFEEVISQHDIPVTASADNPQVIEFNVPLSEISRNPFRKKDSEIGNSDESLRIQLVSNAKNKKNSSLSVVTDFIEIIAPFYDTWPPKSHTDIFIESKNKTNENVYAGEILKKFMSNAWRRPVSEAEIAPFLSLFSLDRPSSLCFEDAMLEVLSTVLATPDFLYLTQKIKTQSPKNSQLITDYELASRLSFFLWCSIPDQELLSLAKQGKLSDPKILAEQTKRMLTDSRSQRFTKNFVNQWLGLDDLNTVKFDETLFKAATAKNVNHDLISPGENPDLAVAVALSSQGLGPLKAAMSEEPIAFFNEVLHQNKSVMDFIHSDYVMVNERLATHYQIPGVYGPAFRAVPIAAKMHRGGLLTTAGILAMNSNGKDSNPVKRGVWILKRFLNDPPPPPPPNVPKVDLTDPEIAKLSLKDQIAVHRKDPACFSCHAKIDPWGIALENFDALGSYRANLNNKPIDSTAILFNKQPLAGMDGLKNYILAERQDQFARAMVNKLTTFALGRPMSFGDREEIEAITEKFRRQGDHLGDLISIITCSSLFRNK